MGEVHPEALINTAMHMPRCQLRCQCCNTEALILPAALLLNWSRNEKGRDWCHIDFGALMTMADLGQVNEFVFKASWWVADIVEVALWQLIQDFAGLSFFDTRTPVPERLSFRTVEWRNRAWGSKVGAKCLGKVTLCRLFAAMKASIMARATWRGLVDVSPHP